MAAIKSFLGVILLPYLICYFAENGVFPSYPSSMQNSVNEMSQLILTQKDDQIRSYCRGKFAQSNNESIKSAIIRKLLNPFHLSTAVPITTEQQTTLTIPTIANTVEMTTRPTNAPINENTEATVKPPTEAVMITTLKPIDIDPPTEPIEINPPDDEPTEIIPPDEPDEINPPPDTDEPVEVIPPDEPPVVIILPDEPDVEVNPPDEPVEINPPDETVEINPPDVSIELNPPEVSIELNPNVINSTKSIELNPTAQPAVEATPLKEVSSKITFDTVGDFTKPPTKATNKIDDKLDMADATTAVKENVLQILPFSYSNTVQGV